MVDVNAFKKFISAERAEHFISPFNLAYEAFCHLEYDKKPREFFKANASEIVLSMRAKCWEDYVPHESAFTARMLCSLIDGDALVNVSPQTAIIDFINHNTDHLYNLFLSNTQSRRSRAGKEFEAIIELLITGAGVPVDTQGVIGKKVFEKNSLGKLVDFVSPGVVEYLSNKRHTVLISAKTTLRERWQEVPEEITRTGIREMYLATLDENISKETLDILYESNVIIVTTVHNKSENYANNDRVITFEDLLQTMDEVTQKWVNYTYTEEQYESKMGILNSKMSKHWDHSFIEKHYKQQLQGCLKKMEQDGLLQDIGS